MKLPHMLSGTYGHSFGCERTQRLVAKVPFISMKANAYYVPELFFVPSFRPVLEAIFPDR